jgi:hypothetical protein
MLEFLSTRMAVFNLNNGEHQLHGGVCAFILIISLIFDTTEDTIRGMGGDGARASLWALWNWN